MRARRASCLRRHNMRVEILLACWLLGLSQDYTSAYTVESLSRACSRGFAARRQIRLSSAGPGSAVSLVLDEGGRGAAPKHCGVDVHAPDQRILSLQMVMATPPKPAAPSDYYRSPCPLAVFSLSRVGRAPRRHLRSVDLCDQEAVSNFSAVFPKQHISLVWMPPYGNFSQRLQASEIVITAVGNGPGVCKTASYRGLFPCWRALCVAIDLVCDGRPNCPDGDDEDPQLCVFRPSPSTPENGNKVGSPSRVPGNNNVLVNASAVDSSMSLPAALNHYGPWGFVMLGMLICGSVLMLCGIWECCCRRSKTPSVATSPTPSVFVVSSSAQSDGNAPPSYEDLDQPPPYNTLFPTLTSKDSTSSSRY